MFFALLLYISITHFRNEKKVDRRSPCTLTSSKNAFSECTHQRQRCLASSFPISFPSYPFSTPSESTRAMLAALSRNFHPRDVRRILTFFKIIPPFLSEEVTEYFDLRSSTDWTENHPVTVTVVTSVYFASRYTCNNNNKWIKIYLYRAWKTRWKEQNLIITDCPVIS